MDRVSIAENFLQDVKKAEGSNLSFAGLYGSVAESRDSEGSDIDVLIVVDKDKRAADNRVHELVVKYLRKSGELISPVVLASSEFRRNKSLRTPYIRNVLAGRVFYGA